MFKIYDGREQFYQWDIDRKLIVEDATISQVHFCNKTDDCSLVCDVYEEDGLRLVDVPNILLQETWRINAYGYDANYTKHCDKFNVAARSKPADYVYTETEIHTWAALDERLTYIEENGGAGGQGEKGEPGDSAYEVALANGFEGTEQEWLASLKGEPGAPGDDGKDGKDGAPGADYVLTDNDKEEIAALALTLLPDAEEVKY